MKLLIGGVRGGMAVADPAFADYGGDSSCFLVEGQGGERIVIDAGTGLRNIQQRLFEAPPESRTVLILFSHFHLDHVAGLPSFKLLYDDAWTVEMASRVHDDLTISDVAHSFVNPPIWPLALDDMKAGKRFRVWDEESMEGPSQYGGLTIRWCPLHHPGGSTAYRIDEPASGRSLVVATDVEWAESSDEEKGWLERLCRLPRPADVLIFDGKCEPDDYEPYRGWGHSTWLEGVELAQRCGVKQLLITHHDPAVNDDACATRDATIQAAWPQARLARQGEWITFE